MCSSHLRSFRVGVLWQGPARGSWSPAAAPAAAAPRRCRRSRWPRPAAPRWRARRKKGGTKTTETRGNDDEIVTFMCIYIYTYIVQVHICEYQSDRPFCFEGPRGLWLENGENRSHNTAVSITFWRENCIFFLDGNHDWSDLEINPWNGMGINQTKWLRKQPNRYPLALFIVATPRFYKGQWQPVAVDHVSSPQWIIADPFPNPFRQLGPAMATVKGGDAEMFPATFFSQEMSLESRND